MDIKTGVCVRHIIDYYYWVHVTETQYFFTSCGTLLLEKGWFIIS